MNKIPIHFPTLDDATVIIVHNFLYVLVETFESHYYHQIQRYERKRAILDDFIETFQEDYDPF